MTTAMNKNEFKGLLAGSIKEKEDGYVVSELFSRYPIRTGNAGSDGRRTVID